MGLPGGTEGLSNGAGDPPIVAVRGLAKTYTMGEVTVEALRKVDLEIARGEFVAISGASGSGKSTFMNILGCLDTPSGGLYLLDGSEVEALSRDELSLVRNRKLGFVFQSFNLLSRTTALENVELPLLYRKDTRPAENREKAMAALRAVGLGERFHHHPNQLSGGQQQRVAIARSMVNDPVLILADEPTGNLDTRSSIEIMGLFQGLNAKGITVVLVTHEPDIASYAGRLIVFRDGKVIRDERNPAPLRAAEELARLRPSEKIT
ncbi:MAG TPA: ABC transporter ATP-binding protein [Fibrobacteria bacterium]|nr:ABC transporter ATP-binding protein [Fibrobacteria bacterium]